MLIDRAGGVAQVAERLPSKCDGLNSNPSIEKQQWEGKNGDWDTDTGSVNSMNQGPCWDAGDMLGWRKPPGRTETSALWTPSLWKPSPHHNTLKDQAGHHPHAADAHPPASPPAHWLLAHPPANPLATTACQPACWPLAPNVLGKPSGGQTEYFPAGPTLGKKKKRRRNKTLKPWTPRTPAHKDSSTTRCQLQTCLRHADKQDWMRKE
jgi:hypothetical protein